jgi:hypothetical protein
VRAGVQMGAALSLCPQRGYGRDLEDQADRVGLRYAHRPASPWTMRPVCGSGSWTSTARRIGSQLLLLGSLAGLGRKRNLEREIANNYR